MVCLTTFGNTKRVISHSLIIFYTFYGYVQGGLCSPEGRPTSHLTYSTPFFTAHCLHTGLSRSPSSSDIHALVVFTSSSYHLPLIALEGI